MINFCQILKLESKVFLLLLFILVFTSTAFTWKAIQKISKPQKGKKVELLFLGDQGHHNPSARLTELMSVLGVKGINFTYTENLDDLNLENLNKYDGLMIYANHEKISHEQEKALLEFANNGKGLIAIHCASFCFQNSDAYIKMVGGQFKSHGLDTFQVQSVKSDHPVIEGVPSFRSYDETYVHDKLNPDKTVLQVRQEGGKAEPYTWVRKQGKGRVFYTAWGHDENTWKNKGFHQLLEQGILWAVGDKVKKQLGDLNLQELKYSEAKLPNYEKRLVPPKKQEPLSVQESLKYAQVPYGFDIQLFASEPDIMKPICAAFDEKGRLWVAVTKDYPNEKQHDQQGRDKILILEDTDNDEKADKFKTFADNLSIPTSMVFYNGGVIVAQAPDMLYLKDTNGDDKMDERKVLFTGWNTFDTHAGPSNLKYGFDNWIWGTVGYAGFKGKIGGKDMEFTRAAFRFKPDGSELEVLTPTSNNTWGLGFSENNDVFISTANNEHSVYLAIPNRYLPMGVPGKGSEGIDRHKGMHPLTDKIRQVDVFGGFTAASGHNLYTARSFPKAYWNRIAFVAEPTGHVLHNAVLNKKGSTYEETDGWNLYANAEEWSAPVWAEVGPEGAVWMGDWYSFITQHNPTPQGFENGKGNAYLTPLREQYYGRIYRISYRNSTKPSLTTLSDLQPGQLVPVLKNDNLLWRLHAQRLLVEKNSKEVLPQLYQLIEDNKVDELGMNTAAIHALWTLHGLGVLDGSNKEALTIVRNAVKHAAYGVRRAALQVLPKTAEINSLILDSNLLNDIEPQVVLSSLLALTETPKEERVARDIFSLVEKPSLNQDKWLSMGLTALVIKYGNDFFKGYVNKHQKKGTQFSDAEAKKSVSSPGERDHLNHIMEGKNKSVEPVKEGFDLIVEDISWTPKKPIVGDPVIFTVTIKNNSLTATEKVDNIGVNFSIDGEKVNWAGTPDNALVPGGTLKLKASGGPMGVNFWTSTTGKHKVKVEIDNWNRIKEVDEANNLIEREIIVEAANFEQLTIGNISRNYANFLSYDSIIALIDQAKGLEEEDSRYILRALSDGWPEGKRPELEQTDKARFKSMLKDFSGENLEALTALGKKWGILEGDISSAAKDVKVIVLKPIPDMIKFDLKEFEVEAGKAVEIVLENTDQMQHNVVIGLPGSLEKIGKAADKMITLTDAYEKNYVPSIPEVITFVKLVDPGKIGKVRFTAPQKKGEYPFVCTFPGHWRIMNGIMKVK